MKIGSLLNILPHVDIKLSLLGFHERFFGNKSIRFYSTRINKSPIYDYKNEIHNLGKYFKLFI